MPFPPRRLLSCTGVLMALMAAPAFAQSSAQTPASSGSQVIPYGDAFFKTQQVVTVLDMISRIPGFSLDEGAQVRGLAGAAGNVLIDGQRPASKTDALENILLRMPASSVERIDLIIGGAPGIDMQGHAQVVNIIRKASTRPNFTGIASIKLYQGKIIPSTRLILSRAGTDRSFEVALLYYGYVDQDSNGGQRLSVDGTTGDKSILTYDTFGMGEGREIKLSRTQPFLGGKIALTGLHNIERYREQNQYAVAGSPISATESFGNRYEQNELGAQYSRDLTTKLKLELNAIWRRQPYAEHDLFSEGADKTFFSARSVTVEKLAAATVSYALSPNQTLRFGVEGAYNSRDSASRLLVNGVSAGLPTDTVLVEEDRSELSAAYIFNPTKRLTLDTGFKYETSTLSEASSAKPAKTLTYPKPRVLATYKANDKTTLRLRVEREVGQLDFDDFVTSVELLGTTIAAGNPDIVPATSWLTEAGVEYRWRENALLGFSYTHEAISDAVDRIPIVTNEGVFDAPGNIGDGTHDKLFAEMNLPTAPYGLKGGVLKMKMQWQSSEVTDPTTHEKRRLSGQNPFDYSLDFRHDITSRRMAWGLNMNSRNDYTTWRVREVTRVKAPDWAQLYFEYKPEPKVSLRLEVNNALAGDRTRARTLYSVSRASGIVSRTEYYRTETQPMLYFRVLANL